jgi:hypothetical protein
MRWRLSEPRDIEDTTVIGGSPSRLFAKGTAVGAGAELKV